MRILILTQWFDPEPAFKGLPFARELVKLGHTVEVLTGFPNYPGGKLYPGYRVRFLQRETIDGISVIRVPLYPSHDTSGVKRAINYISFALSAALIGPFLIKKADVVYVYHPPATVGLAAISIKLFRRIPFVYDIQDLWPDTLSSTGMMNNHFFNYAVGVWCNILYRFASHVVVNSPGLKKILQSRGVHGSRISVIYNWCDDSQLRPVSRDAVESKETQMRGRFNILFAGTMGYAQALDSVLSAAELLVHRLPLVQFVFVGGGVLVDKLKAFASENKLPNVVFLPRRPLSEMPHLMAQADGLLVHLKDDPLFSVTIPSKLQAYMASGRPILLGGRGDAVELLEKSGAGLSCNPDNPESIANAVEKFFYMPVEKRESMGERGKSFYEDNLSMGVGVKHFNEIFRATAGAA